MYEDAAKQLDAIVELVKRCPAELQERCFAILLEGYVQSEQARLAMPESFAPTASRHEPSPSSSPTVAEVPYDARNRIAALGKRLSIPSDQIEQLFDFTADPFVYHPMEAPGDTNAEKARNVVLLVAVRTYIATGSWTADWSEVKARCIDLNCYDATNHAAYLRKGKGNLFKAVEVGKTIELSGPGRTAAEQVLKRLAPAI